ncbi:hypothetical protein [Fusobacterium russii]|uniref:hypothetical protein n=1 Tax=Fusobacterium russii TaxID=854 RepID=UPI00164D4D41|nr:hypothetical protein [Fusobacterium russii]
MVVKKIDNIKIKNIKNELIIKKGWIRKKYIKLYFVFVIILYITSIILVQLDILKEGDIKYLISLLIKCSVVLLYWIYLNSKVLPAFILESIKINFVKKEFVIEGHNKVHFLAFKEIKNININEKSEKNYKIKIIDYKEKEYLFGFALSEKKSQEIKNILSESLIRGEEL